MDYILNRLNRKIAMEENEADRLILSRERLEYCLIFLLDYLWDKNFDKLLFDDKINVINKLQNLQVGDIVSIIKKLDVEKIISNRVFREIDKYPKIRNATLGHGYTHSDCAEEIVTALQNIYDIICRDIEILCQEWAIIFVKKIDEGKAKGEKYLDNGLPDLWTCDQSIYEFYPNRTYAVNKDLQYIKLSPFIEVQNDGESKFVFRKLKEKLTGKVIFNRLISTGTMEKEFKELAEFCVEELTDRRISANSTIMNNFDCNYEKYIDEGVSQGIKQVHEFVEKNNASVNATIWGHGGVGKTACIQKVCMDFFMEATKNWII